MSNVDVRQDERKSPSNAPDRHDPVPGFVDWILGILAAIVGFGLTAASVLVYTQADQEAIRDIVTDQDVEPNGLTQEELITAAEPFTDWLAVGLGVTGLALVVTNLVCHPWSRSTRRRRCRGAPAQRRFQRPSGCRNGVGLVCGHTAVAGRHRGRGGRRRRCDQ